MTSTLFEDHRQISVHALFLGQRLDLRGFEHAELVNNSPPSVKAGDAGLAVLFRYGVVVLFNIQPAEQVGFLEAIRHIIVEPLDEPEHENMVIRCDGEHAESLEAGQLYLKEFDIQRIHLVAHVLAKSVVLAYYETRLTAHFNRIEPLADRLSQQQRIGSRSKQLMQHIGESLLVQSKMTGRVEISEKPDLLWDYPELERLHLRLGDEFDLSERHVAVERKIDLISRTAETLLSILQNQRTLRVEWYIVMLIVVEIAITLIEKLL
ncbi:MAG: RMD1 family protein [Porticoccaceae bacterium]